MGFRSPNRLYDLINLLGLTSGLKLCLDAGDAASYTSGQSWLDTSGNGYDFFRGATSGATTDDPTFNGTPGAKSTSEYWSFDGGDYFRYDSANETWMNNLHKTGAKLSAFAWIYPVTGANNMVFGTNGNTSNTAGSIGVHFGSNSANVLVMRVANGSGATALAGDSTLTVANGVWQAVGVSMDAAIGAGGLSIMLNGAFQSLSSTITSPSASNASFAMEVAGRGNGNSPFPNGSRIAMLAVWEGVALTQAQINSIYVGIVTHQKTASCNVGVAGNVSRAIAATRRANVSALAANIKSVAKLASAGAKFTAAVATNITRALTLNATALGAVSMSRQVSKICRANVSALAEKTKLATATLSANVSVAASAIKSSALTLVSADVRASGSLTKGAFKIATVTCYGLAALILRYWQQRPREDEAWSERVESMEAWTAISKQSEAWLEKTKQPEAWTERPQQSEAWTPNDD